MIEYLNVLSNNYKEDIAFNQWINGHIAAKKYARPRVGSVASFSPGTINHQQ